MKKEFLSTRLVIAILMLTFTAGTFFGLKVYRSNFTLEVSNYTVSDARVTEPVRVVVLADLHNREFEEQNLDIICCIGAFVMDNDENIEVAKTLIEGLVDIAPIYFSMGNHEVHHQMNFLVDFGAIFESYGTKVLEYENEDIQIHGQAMRIGHLWILYSRK